MPDPSQAVKPSQSNAEWLAGLMNDRYPGIAPYGDRLAVPMRRPDGVTSIQIELRQSSPFFLVCAEPIGWQARRELGPDTFALIADPFSIYDDRDNDELVSREVLFLNHQCREWFTEFVDGLRSIIWCAAGIGRDRGYVEGAFYRAGEELYEAEVSATGALNSVTFGALTDEQREPYIASAKAALGGRIGRTFAIAKGRTLALAAHEHLRGIEDFAADTAMKVGETCCEALDQQRVLAVDALIEERRHA